MRNGEREERHLFVLKDLGYNPRVVDKFERSDEGYNTQWVKGERKRDIRESCRQPPKWFETACHVVSYPVPYGCHLAGECSRNAEEAGSGSESNLFEIMWIDIKPSIG